MRYSLRDVLGMNPIDIGLLNNIKKILSAPLAKERITVDSSNNRFYYTDELGQETEVFIQEKEDGGYQIFNNRELIYEKEGTNYSNQSTDYGNSNSLRRTKTLNNMPIAMPVQDGHESAPITRSAAFAKISILVFISILVSLTIASLILLLK